MFDEPEPESWTGPALAVVGAWLVAALWLLSPIDPVPDVVPVVGWIDDALITLAAAAATAWAAARVMPAIAGGAPRTRIEARRPAHEVYEPLDADEIRTL